MTELVLQTMKAFCDGITEAGGSAEFHEYKGEGEHMVALLIPSSF